MSKKFAKHLIALALVLSIMAPLAIVRAQGAASGDVQGNLDEFRGAAQLGGDADANLPKLIGDIVRTVISFLGVVFVIFIIWAGWLYMSAGGDEGKTKTAKKWLYNGVIGLVIIFASYIFASWIIGQIQTATGAGQ